MTVEFDDRRCTCSFICGSGVRQSTQSLRVRVNINEVREWIVRRPWTVGWSTWMLTIASLPLKAGDCINLYMWLSKPSYCALCKRQSFSRHSKAVCQLLCYCEKWCKWLWWTRTSRRGRNIEGCIKVYKMCSLKEMEVCKVVAGENVARQMSRWSWRAKNVAQSSERM